MDYNKKINIIIENLRKLYQQKYGIAVFNVDFKETNIGVELRGEVLTENQKNDIINDLKKNKKRIIKENIKVLSGTDKRKEIEWAIVNVDILDLKLRFVSNKIINNRILNRIRCSQAFKGEVLRILYKNEDQLLVQQSDLTLGWVNRNGVIIKKENLHKEWIQQFHTLGYGIENKILMVNIDKNKIINEAEKYLGTQYLLGGKSKKGIDCSGLVQAVYKNSLNIILPKHSWDQKKIGKKINLKNVVSGDLIFFVNKNNSCKHVGIVKKNKDSISLIHSSLNKKMVVIQDLEEVFKKYNFVEARRIVE